MGLVQFENLPDGTRLAFREDGGGGAGSCGFFWLGGFKSDMEGSKAEAVAALARETRRPALRFDYSGHGKSSGLFTDGTITAWLAQARYMFTAHTSGKRIVIGSSMGGWLALLLLRELLAEDAPTAGRIAGLVLVAPATDMTADLMWDVFPERTRSELSERGVWLMPSSYGEPYPITARLIEDGYRHQILRQGLDCPCPVHILQGDVDNEVPPTHAFKTFSALRGGEVALTLIKGGEHRLSTPSQLSLIRDAARRLAEKADGLSL